MIEITDYDSPMLAATKIVYGTKTARHSTYFGTEGKPQIIDMYDGKELKEIAEHILLYCKNHEGDEE